MACRIHVEDRIRAHAREVVGSNWGLTEKEAQTFADKINSTYPNLAEVVSKGNYFDIVLSNLQQVVDTQMQLLEEPIPSVTQPTPAASNVNYQVTTEEQEPSNQKDKQTAVEELTKLVPSIPVEVVSSYNTELESSLTNINSNPALQDSAVKQKAFEDYNNLIAKEEFKNATSQIYKETPALQKKGTLEQYQDYAAKIATGIILNPSSGGYNIDNKVQDVVYHGSNAEFDGFLEDNLNYFATKDIAKGYGKNIYSVLVTIRKPYYEDGGNLSSEPYEYLYNKLNESRSDGFISNSKNLFVPKTERQIHILGSDIDTRHFGNYLEDVADVILPSSNQPTINLCS